MSNKHAIELEELYRELEVVRNYIHLAMESKYKKGVKHCIKRSHEECVDVMHRLSDIIIKEKGGRK